MLFSMRCVIVDGRIPREAVRSLSKFGYGCIELPGLTVLPEAIRSHPDTLLFHHGRRIITTADLCDAAAHVFSDIRELVPEASIDFLSERHGGCYPDDCILNAAVVGERIFCRTESIAKGVLRYAEEAGLEVVSVRQGYAACATLVLDGGHVISSDRGLCEVYRRHGIDALEIEAGGISLPPYEYGFIGGAAGVDGGRVFFLGEVARHPSGERIVGYIRDCGLEPVSLCDGELTDLGGLVFLP